VDRYSCGSFGYWVLESHTSPLFFSQPPLPPKSIDRLANSSRTFGFSSKASFVSFASLQGSSVSLLRGSRSSTEPTSNPSIFESKRRSTDDGESSKGRGNSHSSSISAELKLPKVSIFSKLRSRSSKPNLRQEGDESDLVLSPHSSLLPPVPPLPTKEQSEITQDGFQYVEGPAPAIFVPPPARKEKRDKGKKKAKVPLLPPKYPTKEMEQLLNSVEVDLSHGIVGFDKDAMSGIVNFSQSDGTNHQNVGQSPPSSGRNNPTPTPSESQSYSQIFSNPWRPPSPSEKWSSHSDMRKVSPRSIIAPHLNSSSSIPSPSSHAVSSSPTSPEQWVPPESWAIARPHDAYERLSHDHVSSGSDDDIVDDDLSSMMGIGKWKGDWTTRMGSRKNTASSATSLISEPWKPANALVRLPFTEPRSLSLYHFRIYRQLGEYYLVGVKLSFTVQEICEKLKPKLAPKDQHIQHNLYLKEQGRGAYDILVLSLWLTFAFWSERILAPHECPAAIVKLRQEQAGYDYEDGVHLFSNEALNMLLKFMYKSQVLTDVRSLTCFLLPVPMI
jgi:adenylate cyclase